MATDKALPNVQQTIKLPSPKDVQIEQQQQTAQQMTEPVDIQKNEDGSVDINFDPNTVNPGDTKEHFANLADLLPDNVLSPLGHKLYQDYQDYKTSRKDWEFGLKLFLNLLHFYNAHKLLYLVTKEA